MQFKTLYAWLLCIAPLTALTTGAGCGGGSSPVAPIPPLTPLPPGTATPGPFSTGTPTMTPTGNPTATPTATSTPSAPIATRFDNDLAFSNGELGQYGYGVYRSEADGSNQRLLVSQTALENLSRGAAIRPSGREVAFYSNSPDRDHRFIYLMNADGTNIRRLRFGAALGNGVGGGAWPAWSPDGNLLTGASAYGGHLFVARVDGSQMRFLSEGAFVREPTFSPDGNSILFVQNNQLKRVSLLVGSPTTVDTDDIISIRSPHFSPNGKTLAFVGFQSSSSAGPSVYLANPNGSGARIVANTSRAERVLWSPANELAFEADGALYTIGRDGTNKRLIARGFDFDWR